MLAQQNPCTWNLRTRTGKHTHYAIIVDIDPHGTPEDQTDDTVLVIGYAARTNIDMTANQRVTNEVLDAVDTVDLDVELRALTPSHVVVKEAMMRAWPLSCSSILTHSSSSSSRGR